MPQVVAAIRGSPNLRFLVRVIHEFKLNANLSGLVTRFILEYDIYELRADHIRRVWPATPRAEKIEEPQVRSAEDSSHFDSTDRYDRDSTNPKSAFPD